MTAVYSCTIDPKYDFFIPITEYCWYKLGIKSLVICPKRMFGTRIFNLIDEIALPQTRFEGFMAREDKEATYAQISRMYASSLPNIPNEEILISGDVDMCVFKNIFENTNGVLFNLGFDLVPENQLPMCFTWGEAWAWDVRFEIKGKSLQECLDQQLSHEEMINMRGCLWSRDQEIMAKAFSKYNYDSTIRIPRAREGTSFAAHRVDRDDTNWRAYLGPDLIDAHLWRPGYTDENFANIMELLQTQFPEDNFDWLRTYRNEYIKLL